MKKLLVVLLALTCLSALAFADASIGFGFGRTQFSVASSSSATGADIVQGFAGNGDSWPPAPRANLDVAYSSDHAAFHFTAYLDGTTLTWPGLYGSLKLVPDMFTLLIGEFNNDGWDTFRKTSPHPIRDVNNGNVGRFGGWGVILDIAPKDSGFEAAVMYETGDPTLGASQDTLNRTMVNTSIAASYTLPGMLKITAGSQNPVLYTPNRNIFGRVEVLMVPNLTLWVDGVYSGFDLTPTSSTISALLAAAYDMKPLTIVFAAGYATTDITGTSISGWAVYPEVYYNMGALTLGLFAKVEGDNTANSTIGYEVEPYLVLNDFNLRVSFNYVSPIGNTAVTTVTRWEVPVLITWGF